MIQHDLTINIHRSSSLTSEILITPRRRHAVATLWTETWRRTGGVPGPGALGRRGGKWWRNDGEMMENHDGEHDFLTFLMNLWYLWPVRICYDTTVKYGLYTMVAIHQMPVAVVHRPHESLRAHDVQSDDQPAGVGVQGGWWDDLWDCVPVAVVLETWQHLLTSLCS